MTAAQPVIRIDPRSALPPYDQIRAQLAAAMEAGTLAPGQRLPTVRALAGQLNLAVNTVARAYRELEAAGLVETGRRAGTVVSARGDLVRERLVAAARRYADQARATGVETDEALRIVTAALSARPGSGTSDTSR